MIILPSMGLRGWNSPTDPYSSAQLFENFQKLDRHDHSPGKGAPLTGVSLADGTIAADKFTATTREALGLNSTTIRRRGKSIIATEESRTSTSYGLMTTPDRVPNITLPTDGLIVVAYQAMWKSSVSGAGKASLFLGTNAVQTARSDLAAPTAAEATSSTTVYAPLSTSPLYQPLNSASGQSPAYTGDVTTGQMVLANSDRSGIAHIFAAAGTYDVSVQFRATSGSVTAQNRKLWVWTIGFPT